MKRKYFLVVLFLILAMFLSGCSGGGIVTPATDEAKVESVIQNYALAMNDQDWSKAKSCCIYGSGEYNTIAYIKDVLDNYNSYHLEYINIYIDIYDVHIYGDYSEVYSYATLVVSECGNVYSASGYFWQYLQKIDNTWKINNGFFSWYMSEN